MISRARRIVAMERSPGRLRSSTGAPVGRSANGVLHGERIDDTTKAVGLLVQIRSCGKLLPAKFLRAGYSRDVSDPRLALTGKGGGVGRTIGSAASFCFR